MDFWEHDIFGNKEFLANTRFLGTRNSCEQEILGNKRFLGTRDSWEQEIFWNFTNTGFGRRDSNWGFNNYRIKHCIMRFYTIKKREFAFLLRQISSKFGL